MSPEELHVIRRLARAGADIMVTYLASIADKYIHSGEE